MITIKKIKGKKTINGQTLDTILEGVDPLYFDPVVITNIFGKIHSEDELIEELRKMKADNTPTKLLLYIRHLTDLSLMEATEILGKL
jgi:hypothetical protein